jgi:hypothetical protein
MDPKLWFLFGLYSLLLTIHTLLQELFENNCKIVITQATQPTIPKTWNHTPLTSYICKIRTSCVSTFLSFSKLKSLHIIHIHILTFLLSTFSLCTFLTIYIYLFTPLLEVPPPSALPMMLLIVLPNHILYKSWKRIVTYRKQEKSKIKERNVKWRSEQGNAKLLKQKRRK